MQSDSDEDDFSPRDYQMKLMEISWKDNTIIYLPTGSGKTFIAVMVLRQLAQPLEKPTSKGGKISIMLVNTVALVDQHCKYFKRFTPFDVGAYSGEQNVDSWDRSIWREEFDKYQIFVMTSQILVNLVESSILSLSEVNLLIFDECHRGVNDHAMRQIMINFKGLENPPRVLGLTATLLNKNCSPNQVMTEVEALETTFHSKVATVDELRSVIGYSTNPKEFLKIFNTHNPDGADGEAIRQLDVMVQMLEKIKLETTTPAPPKPHLKLLEPEKGLKDLINLIKDTTSHITLFGPFGGRIAIIAHIIQLERIKRACQDLILATILESITSKFIAMSKLLRNAMYTFSPKEQIYKFSSHQVHVLFDILKEYKTISSENLCGIIFVQRRFTAKVLYNILLKLKDADEDFKHINPNFVVGFNTNPYNDTREGLYNVKMNKKVLNQFQNKEINLLVASNVLEEGVDVPMCTFVVKFDKPLDYRAYIQSKGRARHKTSLYYMMIDSMDFEAFVKKYKMYLEVEDLLNCFLVGQNENRDGPTDEQIQDLYHEQGLRPYYANGVGSAQVTSVSSISLLCRYCMQLPSDKYTSYTPNWYLEQRSNRDGTFYKVVIELPTIAPILEPIEGVYMRTKKQAKRAAALKACEILHKCGELDDQLLPKRHDVLDEDTSSFFTHWPETKEKDAGNSRKRRVHDKQIPSICRGQIKENEDIYLHVVELKPIFLPNTESQSMIFDLYSSHRCYGVITHQPLPPLCSFSLYVSMGEIMVNFQVNQKTLQLTEEQILDLRAFHVLIFKDVLKVLKNFLIFDNGEAAEGLVVVPIAKENQDFNIDFDVVINNKELVDQKSEPNDQDKLKLVVSDETYLGKIVTPWYRSDDKQYFVTSVCSDVNALSKFPSEDFDTYASYFNEKYRTNVLNPTQPMLLVKGLSKRMNCLKPRNFGSKRSKEKCYEEMEEHLIPELCVKQDFPADLWVQANLLPSILHRVTTLLQAEELRTTIALESGLGVVKLEANDKWLPLVLDPHLLNTKTEEPEKTKSQKVAEYEPDSVIKTIPTIAIQQHVEDCNSKKLEVEFPWQEKDEPIDIERYIGVTLMDIQYYENFVSQKVTINERIKKSTPVFRKDVPAITFDRDFVENDIDLLNPKANPKCPELAEIFRSLATAKCNDIVNLERLETLGDSFLKLSISLFITLRFPKYDEGKATTLKGQLISNKNLYYVGVAKKLPGYMKLSYFTPSFEWKPPCFSVPTNLRKKIDEKQIPATSLFYFVFSDEEQCSGNLKSSTNSEISDYKEQSAEEEKDDGAYDSMFTFMDLQTVPDKAVADTVEALIGAYFKSCGFEGGLKMLEWLNIIPKIENIGNLLEVRPQNPILMTNATNSNIDFHIPSWRMMEERLGYKFKNRAYLLQALTHSSYTPNRITNCYQTLEFLGDAILDFLITCHIYETCGNLNPGQLTDLRSALVNNITFAGFTVRCGFHKFLLFSNNKLLEYINMFVAFQESKDFAIDDEVLILLEENGLYLAEHVDVPKVLGDVFEALAGAVFLDSGMNLQTVWKVFYRIMWKEIESFRHKVPKNAIRLLYETVGAHPEYQNAVDIDTGGTMVGLDFMLNGARKRVHGFGENKALAKKAAAKIALRLLQK